MTLLGRGRPLRALQVEITSRCDRRCAVCPRTLLGDQWREGDLDPESWRRLRSDLELAEHVHLQGWGEPLLHPDVDAMVADAKAAGCEVGLTTNGDLVDGALDWIVTRGVDLVTVSVAGSDARDAGVRDSASSAAAWQAVSALATRRRRRPRVQVSYLLTVDNAPLLPSALRDAAEAGADELFVIHLDCTPTAELRRRAAFDGTRLRAGVEQFLDEAAAAARRAGIRYREPARRAEEMLVCALDPRRIVFVGFDGRVGPCVNLLPPVEAAFRRWTEEGVAEVEPVAYGDLHDASLQEILASERARAFVAPFEARCEAERRFLAAQGGWGTAALERLERTAEERSEALARTPFPPSCAGCPKARGW